MGSAAGGGEGEGEGGLGIYLLQKDIKSVSSTPFLLVESSTSVSDVEECTEILSA